MSARRQFSNENCRKTRIPILQVKLYILGVRRLAAAFRSQPTSHSIISATNFTPQKREQAPALQTTHFPSSPPNSEKSAIVVNSRNNSASSANRFFRTAASSAITITSTKN